MNDVSSPVSRWADLGGPVHYLDFGGPQDGPLVVCVHGLGASAANWVALAPLLADRCRVLALDLTGDGLTPLTGRASNVQSNRRLVDRFLREVAGTPAILVGNSMGGLISILEASAAPRSVAGMVLLDPALPKAPGAGSGSRPDVQVVKTFAAYAVPGIGERFLASRRRRATPEELFQETMELCTVDPSRVPQSAVDASVAVIREREKHTNEAAKAYLGAARSILLTMARPAQFLHKLRTTPQPTLLIHGAHDKLVPVAAARRAAQLRPDWRFVVNHDIGHVPQLEAVDWTAAQILDWLDTAGRPAAEAAAGAALDQASAA